jgi:hypothetical protein
MPGASPTSTQDGTTTVLDKNGGTYRVGKKHPTYSIGKCYNDLSQYRQSGFSEGYRLVPYHVTRRRWSACIGHSGR